MKARSGLACAAAIAVVLGRRAASADAGDTCVSAYEGAQQDQRDGAFVKAREELALCRGACPAALAKDCAAWTADVERAIAHVEVVATVDGVTAPLRSIAIDGVARPERGVIDLDPGAHVVRVVTSGGASGEQRITLAPGERRAVRVTMASPPGRGFSPGPGAVVLAAVGGAAVLAGAGLGVAGHVERSDLADTCAPDCTEADVDAVRNTWIAGGVIAGAGVLALGGAVLWALTHDDAQPSDAALRVTPSRAGRGPAILVRF